MSDAEAILLDPQQRLLLECSAEALAAANRTTALTTASIASRGKALGAYVGVASSDYASVVKAHTSAGAYHATANALSVASGRLAFVFGFSGVSAAVALHISLT